MEEQIKAKFANASKYFLGKYIYKTPEEFAELGLNKFKKTIFGFCRKQTVKSLDELAEILTDLKIADSTDGGKQLIQEFYGKEIRYGGSSALKFERVQNKEGQEACRITRYKLTCDD